MTSRGKMEMQSSAMRVRSMAPGVFLALAAGACDPANMPNVRQSLRPAPDADCLGPSAPECTMSGTLQRAGPCAA